MAMDNISFIRTTNVRGRSRWFGYKQPDQRSHLRIQDNGAPALTAEVPRVIDRPFNYVGSHNFSDSSCCATLWGPPERRGTMAVISLAGWYALDEMAEQQFLSDGKRLLGLS
jgi:hypothetical protein